jgi:peptide/nickel transport system permease protein
MLAFIIRRAIQALGVLLAVGLISFAMFRFAGDPVNQIVSLDTPAAEREQVRRSLGLDDPVIVQFARYVAKAAQFDFGVSYQFRQPVAQLLAERMPATLELAFCATLFALIFGILMGIVTALRRDSALSKLLLAVSLVGISLPTFLIGILLIYALAVDCNGLPSLVARLTFIPGAAEWVERTIPNNCLPSYGRGETVKLGWWSTGLLTASGLKSLIMPSITLGLFQMTLIMRLVRAEMLEVLRADYIRFARARGLTTRSIHFGHALKNTLVPVITIAGLQLGSIIAFAIITETVFQWPGMGLLFVQAVQNVDIPIMAAYLLLVALIFVAINLAVDLLYSVVDPRLRGAVGRAA